MNLTILPETSKEFDCKEWCLEQHITGFNNIETLTVMFVAGALIMIVGYEFCQEHEKLKKYSYHFIIYSKVLIYMFFFMYFIVLKLKLYHYIT